MIKFFKNIRHETLTDNPPDGRAGKFSKYLMYAFGEILLVVIGILIALQINNWNENRKASLLEIETLRNLKEDLIYNASKIKIVYSNDSLIASRNTKLLVILKDRYSIYDDSLETYFGMISRYDVFSPRKMAYEALKSEGLEIIKNDSIRSAIILLYDETYLLNIHTVEMRKEIHVNSIAFFNKRLFTLENVDSKVPIDFDALKLDTEFINNLSYITAESKNFNLYTKDMLDKTKSVADKIGNELKRLENQS